LGIGGRELLVTERDLYEVLAEVLVGGSRTASIVRMNKSVKGFDFMFISPG
jgi:hypothetical protein